MGTAVCRGEFEVVWGNGDGQLFWPGYGVLNGNGRFHGVFEGMLGYGRFQGGDLAKLPDSLLFRQRLGKSHYIN